MVFCDILNNQQETSLEYQTLLLVNCPSRWSLYLILALCVNYHHSNRETVTAMYYQDTCSFSLKFSFSNLPSFLSWPTPPPPPAESVSSSRETNSGLSRCKDKISLLSRCKNVGVVSSPSSLLTCWREQILDRNKICLGSQSTLMNWYFVAFIRLSHLLKDSCQSKKHRLHLENILAGRVVGASVQLNI